MTGLAAIRRLIVRADLYLEDGESGTKARLKHPVEHGVAGGWFVRFEEGACGAATTQPTNAVEARCSGRSPNVRMKGGGRQGGEQQRQEEAGCHRADFHFTPACTTARAQ